MAAGALAIDYATPPVRRPLVKGYGLTVRLLAPLFGVFTLAAGLGVLAGTL